MRSSAVLVGFLFLVACSDENSPNPRAAAVPTEDTESGALDCGSETVDLVRREIAGREVWIVDPDPGLGPAELLWRHDLNGDGLDDLALSFPQAGGNWGDVPISAYAACRSGRFLGVWGPDYAVSLESGERTRGEDGQGWSELAITRREGDTATTRHLEFVRGGYRRKSIQE